MRRAFGLGAVVLLLFSCAIRPVQPAELEGFEDEPDVPSPKQPPAAAAQPVKSQPAQAETGNPAVPSVQITETAQPGDAVKAAPVWWSNPPRTTAQLVELLETVAARVSGAELLCIFFVGLYLINLVRGTGQNEKIAISWAKTFCSDGQLLDRNFAQLCLKETGATEVLVRESRSSFLFYASGRRFCQNLTARMQLQQRQDLMSLAYYKFTPRDDYVDVEVHMNEASMPPLVLAVIAKRLAKPLMRKQPDIEKFAKRVEVTRDRIATWPSDLVVYAEHPSIFYDLMTDQLLEQIFSKDAFPAAQKYFRYLHFTSEAEVRMDGTAIKLKPGTASKRVLRFSLGMPPADKMEDQNRLLTAACHCIDVMGSYARDGGFSAEHKKVKDALGRSCELNLRAYSIAVPCASHERRAETKRRELEQAKFKETLAERQESLEEKKYKKMVEEAERVKKMTPQQRAKYREKQEKLQMKRMSKARMVKK